MVVVCDHETGFHRWSQEDMKWSSFTSSSFTNCRCFIYIIHDYMTLSSFIPALCAPSSNSVIVAFHIHGWQMKTELTATPWMTLSSVEHAAHCSTSGHLKQTNVIQSRVASRIPAILWATGGLSCRLPWKPALLKFIIFPHEWRAGELQQIFVPVVKNTGAGCSLLVRALTFNLWFLSFDPVISQ